MDISNVTACVYLDNLGRYAKAPEFIHTVRLFSGEGCDHVDITAAQHKALTLAQRTTLEGLGGRPECIDTEGKSNA
jgi:hypothetical protein